MIRSTIPAAVLVVTAALGLSGWSNGGGNSGGGSSAMDTSTVKIADSKLGNILVDGSGRTLYLFTMDGHNKSSMKCDAACLKLWPPLEGKPKAGHGVDAKLINTTDAGGKPQATYGGHPLYYYAKDKASGDVKGQGIGKVWYVVDAHGKAVMKAVGQNSGQYGY
ncbi:hypothetical protein [Streptomyces sp. NPDC019890]|uniref:COG4315 family predicted lipoprotein n=1 Tax=Streptomyces sp. NPDC019890 TaxID=3365064 RepID=UPI00385000B0